MIRKEMGNLVKEVRGGKRRFEGKGERKQREETVGRDAAKMGRSLDREWEI